MPEFKKVVHNNYPKKIAEDVNNAYGEDYQQVVAIVSGRNFIGKKKINHIEIEDEMEKYDEENTDYIRRR